MVWDIDPVLLDFGRVQVRYYGVCFLIALLGGFLWWRWQILRSGRSPEFAERVLWPAVLAVIVGARLGHVLFYEWDKYSANPLEILYFWQGGLASHGAATALVLAIVWFARHYKMNIREVGDRMSFAIAWAAAWVRVGNFMNSEIVGRVTDVAWAVRFPRHDGVIALPRHPSQLYEFAMGMAVLAILLVADRLWKREKRPLGGLIFLFLICYFSGRFGVEFFKAFQTLEAGLSALTMGQYLSLPFIAFGVVGLAYVLRNPAPTDQAVARWRETTTRPNQASTSGKTKTSKNKR